MPDSEFRSILYKFPPETLEPQNLKEIANAKGWKSELSGLLTMPVERDILTFDTFAILAELTDHLLSFGGGTLLNWAYARELPRFSFDIDSQARKLGLEKKHLLEGSIEALNQELRQQGKVQSVSYKGRDFEIGTVILDSEKDHFPDVLSLKRRVYASTCGSPAHTYFKKEAGEWGGSNEDLHLKKYYGGRFPNVEDVRIEIGLPETTAKLFPVQEIKVLPLVYPAVKVAPVTASLTPKEFVMALKVVRLGKDFKPEELSRAISDLVKALFDLHACSKSCQPRLISEGIKQICSARDLDAITIIRKATERTKEMANGKEAKDQFERSGQTSFVAQMVDFDTVISSNLKLLSKLP